MSCMFTTRTEARQPVATNFAFVTISSPWNTSRSRTRVHALGVNSLRAPTQVIAELGRRERERQDALRSPPTTAQITSSSSSFTPLFQRPNPPPTLHRRRPSVAPARALRAYLALEETAARLKSHQKSETSSWVQICGRVVGSDVTRWNSSRPESVERVCPCKAAGQRCHPAEKSAVPCVGRSMCDGGKHKKIKRNKSSRIDD